MNQEEFDEEMYGRQVTGEPECHWYGNGWVIIVLIAVVVYLLAPFR